MKRFLDDRKEYEDKDPIGKAIAEISSQATPNVRVVHVIVGGAAAGGSSSSQRKKYARSVFSVAEDRKRKKSEPISFSDDDLEGVQTPHNDALVVSAIIGGVEVRRLLVDTGSSCEMLYSTAFEKMGFQRLQLEPYSGPIVGLTGHEAPTIGVITLLIIIR